MKKINKLLMLPLAAMIWSCSDTVIDGLSGTYDTIQRYNFVSGQTQDTDKLKKGLKCLNMLFTDAAGNKFDLKVVSDEWTLKAGSYTPVADVLAAPAVNQYQGRVGSASIVAGTLDVNIIDGIYYISGILDG